MHAQARLGSGRRSGTSHHYTRQPDGSYRYFATNFRCIWPAECDLVARLAGLQFVGRWADWHRSPFNSASMSHISAWSNPGAP